MGTYFIFLGTFKTSNFLDVVLTLFLIQNVIRTFNSPVINVVLTSLHGYKNVIRTLRNNNFRLYWVHYILQY